MPSTEKQEMMVEADCDPGADPGFQKRGGC